MHFALTADVEHRHDVRMLEKRRRLGLVLEALELAGVQRRRQWQDLEGQAPAGRWSLGLVDDAHAAAANLAHQAIVAETSRPAPRGWPATSRCPTGARPGG